MEIQAILYQILNIVVTCINLFGITIVFWGFVVAAMSFIRMKLHHHGVIFFLKEASEIRAILGTYILFGLEFMIAGDIIHTFIKPSQEDLIVLATIVAIRTVISYFLGREVDGALRDKADQKVFKKELKSKSIT
ncbi:MAG TPA: DUF1622 domain-containing protein [Alphaproteobacteria bacterium]|nr:DUF1622 domain-containing protein [Alphaproteobacteria bacterium]